MTCWLAQFSDEPCDGVEDLCHLIPKQVIKREVSDDPDVVWHPSVWVRGCRRHHGMLDVPGCQTLRIPRDQLPSGVLLFAQHFDLEWWIEREYGAVQPLHSGFGLENT